MSEKNMLGKNYKIPRERGGMLVQQDGRSSGCFRDEQRSEILRTRILTCDAKHVKVPLLGQPMASKLQASPDALEKLDHQNLAARNRDMGLIKGEPSWDCSSLPLLSIEHTYGVVNMPNGSIDRWATSLTHAGR